MKQSFSRIILLHAVVYGVVSTDDTISDLATCSVDAHGVDRCVGRPSNSSIPVVIVDEHHHVVDHWFSMPGVRESHFYNATLVHIDGHSDYGLPLTKDLLAPFPQDLNKLRENLENDQFIVMAIRHGIIGRVINIYPFFSYQYVHPDKKRIRYTTVGMHKDGIGWCECASACRYIDKCKRHCEVDDERVKSRHCRIEREIEIVDYGIHRAAAEGFSVDTGQPLIIDIDEDFFAVESPFVKAMLTGHLAKDKAEAAQKKRKGIAAREWRTGRILERIQRKVLFGVFCARPPRVQQRERAVDVFFRGLETVVLAMKESESKVTEVDMRAIVARLMSVNTTLLHEVSDALCRKQIQWKDKKNIQFDGGDVIVLPETAFAEFLAEEDEELIQEVAWKFAWALYTEVPVQGIFKMITYGFCIHCDEVPRAGYYLWVCLGASKSNDQTSGRLELHDATADEVSREMLRLRSVMLANLKLPATMVTICRSSRDGYIPKELWSQVEDGVLEIVGSLSRDWDRNMELKHDRDCYWGATSVPARTVLPVRNFMHSEGLGKDGYYCSKVIMD